MRNALMTNWMQEVDDMFRSFSPSVKYWEGSPSVKNWERSPALKQWDEQSWFSPAVDVQESEKEYLFHFDLPGLTDKDLQIQVTGRELNVSGERKFESKEGQRKHRSERFFGKFERSFVLPDEVNADKIEAKFKDGVLEIRVPKVEAVQPKSIPIRTH